MSPSWIDNLERSLEERLEQFLRSNPSQDQLLREQHLQDRQRDLHNRRGQQQLQARELRRQLLTLAEQVQAWTQRGEKARRAGALELAQRADQHVVALMQQGRELWEEFEAQYEAGGFWLAIWHPFLTGRLARWRQVETWLEKVLERGDVWFAPMHEIAAHVRAEAAKDPNAVRVEDLPYYTKPVLF